MALAITPPSDSNPAIVKMSFITSREAARRDTTMPAIKVARISMGWPRSLRRAQSNITVSALA